jgi:predicted amidohydrolase
MKKIRVILYQKPLGIKIPEQDIDEIGKFSPHFVCFPEYFFIDPTADDHEQTYENQVKQMHLIENLSREIKTVVIGGTMPEFQDDKLYNTCFVYDNGRQLGFYRKINLFAVEEGKVTPGDSYKIFSAYGMNFGVLICADVFHKKSFKFMRKNKVRVIFSPTFSPLKKETIKEKYKRDKKIYVGGASIAHSVIVKVCGVKSEYKNDLQARSLIANGKEVIYRVKPDEEDAAMIIKKEIEV